MSDQQEMAPTERLVHWAKQKRWPLLLLSTVAAAVSLLAEPASYFLGDLYVRVWLRELGFAYVDFNYSAERLHTIFISHSLTSLMPVTQIAFSSVVVAIYSAIGSMILLSVVLAFAPNLFGRVPCAERLDAWVQARKKAGGGPPRWLLNRMDWAFSRGAILIVAMVGFVAVVYLPLHWAISKAERDAQALVDRGFLEPAGLDDVLVAKCATSNELDGHSSVVLVSCGTTECAVIGDNGLRLGVKRKQLKQIETRVAEGDVSALKVCGVARATAKPTDTSSPPVEAQS